MIGWEGHGEGSPQPREGATTSQGRPAAAALSHRAPTPASSAAVPHALLRCVLGPAQTTAMGISNQRSRNRHHPAFLRWEDKGTSFPTCPCPLSASTLYFTPCVFPHQCLLGRWKSPPSQLTHGCRLTYPVGTVSTLMLLVGSLPWAVSCSGLSRPVFWEAA